MSLLNQSPDQVWRTMPDSDRKDVLERIWRRHPSMAGRKEGKILDTAAIAEVARMMDGISVAAQNSKPAVADAVPVAANDSPTGTDHPPRLFAPDE